MSKWSFPTGDLMKGKRGVVMGVANDSSIAWGIAQQLAAQGAEIAFTYQGENLERRVRPLVESIGMNTMIPADVVKECAAEGESSGVRIEFADSLFEGGESERVGAGACAALAEEVTGSQRFHECGALLVDAVARALAFG